MPQRAPLELVDPRAMTHSKRRAHPVRLVRGLDIVHPVDDEGPGGASVQAAEDDGSGGVAPERDLPADFFNKGFDHLGGLTDPLSAGRDAFLPEKGAAALQVLWKGLVDGLVDLVQRILRYSMVWQLRTPPP